MNEKKYTIKLEDGTLIENLHLNGNNFISKEEIDEDLFIDNLSNVVISDGTNEEVHDYMKLVRFEKTGNEYWFAIIDIPISEIEKEKLRSDVDYLAMMANIEI